MYDKQHGIPEGRVSACAALSYRPERCFGYLNDDLTTRLPHYTVPAHLPDRWAEHKNKERGKRLSEFLSPWIIQLLGLQRVCICRPQQPINAKSAQSFPRSRGIPANKGGQRTPAGTSSTNTLFGYSFMRHPSLSDQLAHMPMLKINTQIVISNVYVQCKTSPSEYQHAVRSGTEPNMHAASRQCRKHVCQLVSPHVKGRSAPYRQGH